MPINTRATLTEKNTTFLLPLLMLFVDYVAIVGAFEAAAYLRFHSFWNLQHFNLGWINQFVTVPAIFLMFIHVEKLYKRRTQFWQLIPKILHACNYAMLSVIVLMYAAHVSEQTSRLFVAFLWVLSFIFITVLRYISRKIMDELGLLQLPVIVVGAGPIAEALVHAIENDAGMGYRVVGLVTNIQADSEILKKYAVLGDLNAIETIVRRTGVNTVMIALGSKSKEWLSDYVNRVKVIVKNVAVVPNLMEVPVGNVEVEGFFDEKIMLLKMINNLARPLNVLLKNIFDYVLVICGSIFVLPILVVVVWKIHCDSPGPIIYDGERIGRNGKLFKCYKFRSMYINGDEILEKYLKEHPDKRIEWETYHKLDKDPRVTPIGDLLRRTSLDELPQLLNVLLGDMSLVGPRPYLPTEKRDMGSAYSNIVLTKPGITGYWQVNGRSNVDFKNRLKMDCWYVANWSVWMDVWLLYKTIFIVLNKQGAK